MSRFGNPILIIPDYGPKTIKPSGIASIRWGANEVQNFNRNIYPKGWVEFTVSPPVAPSWPRRSTWVSHEYDPFPFAGKDSSVFGLPWVSFRVRSLYPEGADTALVGEYTPGHFKDRMRVWKRDGVSGITLGSTLLFGHPTIGLQRRTLQPRGIASPLFGSASLRRVNRVNASGWDSSIFGDVQRWESGKIKPYGDELSLFGNARIDRVVQPSGWSGEVGMPSVAISIGVNGFQHEGLGVPTLTATVCGPRAIAVPSFSSASIGTPEVEHA